MSEFEERFTLDADSDLLGLFDFLVERNIASADRAQTAIAKALEMLEVVPFSCCKAVGGSRSPFLRELIIPFGGSLFVPQFVPLFEIEDLHTVTVIAVRHQREEDSHCPPVRRSKPEIILFSE